ncbi:hypothetical protein [uncultured Nostoc sp.]|uniref:hypothetical protein n=1 Tax=uncultured Nostoc sp. TaxID=340711 RepID=UPI0035CB79C5
MQKVKAFELYYSVYECQLTNAKYQDLRRRLRKKLKLTEDSLRFYPLSRPYGGTKRARMQIK